MAANQHVIVDSGTVTTLTNLPAAPQGWLTAEAIDTDALDGKGNWSTYAGGAATPSDVSVALTAYGAAKPSDLPTLQSIAAAVAATAELKAILGALTGTTSVANNEDGTRTIKFYGTDGTTAVATIIFDPSARLRTASSIGQ